MTIPSFAGEYSLHAHNQYVGNYNGISKSETFITTQFNGSGCIPICVEDCLCLHDAEGVIESSCLCTRQCTYDCPTNPNRSGGK